MQTNLRIKPEVLGLIAYLLYLLIITMNPFEFSVSPNRYFELLESFYTVSFRDFVLNVILFIPFGFLLFSLLKNVALKDYIKILICSVLGAGLSFTVEIYQLYLPRDSTLSDVVINTTGAFVGAVLAKFYYKKAAATIGYFWNGIQGSKSLLTLAVILYSAIVFILSVFPIQHIDFHNRNLNPPFGLGVNFHNWDPNFTLQLGNEPTFDRPWSGKVYLLAIYNRNLPYNKVYTNFMAGPYTSNSIRFKDGLIAFYNFNEGSGKVVHDTSGFSQPLDLIIYNPSRVRWLFPNGLEILRNTIVKSRGPVKKLYNALSSTNELSIEAWIAPNKLSNTEWPARIVSFSKDPIFRNFTLSQLEKSLLFRLRTPLTGNGNDINLKTEDSFSTTGIQHLVVTYERGVERLFVNGLEYKNIVIFDDKLLYSFGRNAASKTAFCLFFFLPLSFLFYALLLNRFEETTKPYTLSAISAFFSLGLLFAIEVVNVWVFPQGFDFTLLLLGVVVGFFSTFFCIICANSGFFSGSTSTHPSLFRKDQRFARYKRRDKAFL